MVDFIRPNLLGSLKDFTNRFINPITNGQYSDSTPLDVELMKGRSHVLHKMLEGFIQVFYIIILIFTKKKLKLNLVFKLTIFNKKCQIVKNFFYIHCYYTIINLIIYFFFRDLIIMFLHLFYLQNMNM